jgi:N-acetylneuraminic acid mutarotase
MAQYALPPGAVRRRAVFGLLDADGWGWATLKASFWFLLIIFLQGYVPDRAYYFTVAPAVDVGFNAISPINWCPADNKTLPCPAPPGAVIPWEESPAMLALPSGRAGAGSFTSGTSIYVIGGRTADGTTASVLTSTVFEGNLTTWQEAAALPEPRSDAAVVNFSGVPYVVGGSDASGAPTATVFRGIVENGVLAGWEAADDIALPEALTDVTGVSTGGGLYLFGGRTAEGVSAKTYRSELSTTGTRTLQGWVELTELPLPEARANGTAVSTGSSVYIVGGEGPNGPTNSVFYLGFDTHGLPETDTGSSRAFGWGVSVGQSAGAALPEARYGHTSFTNSGTVFSVGGYNQDGQAVNSNVWTLPSFIDGTIPSWDRREVTDLPAPRAEAAAALVGQHVFVIGGTSGGSAYLDSTIRADVAPRLPFFRLGLFGLTVPALSIKGEIGQQLGYIVAASAALGNFVLLVVIAWMYSHKAETFRFFRWITRGRFRPPPEDDYQT